jgi:hypothetical protein
MNFTEHMKRIMQLGSQALIYEQEKKPRHVIANLESIRGHLTSAMNIYIDTIRKNANEQNVREPISF